MSQNTIKTRIQLKNDTEANWTKAINFCPLKGELIIYSADEAHPFPRLKVGDGTTLVSDLPFINAENNIDNKIKFNTADYWGARAQTIPEENLIIIYTDGGQLSSGIKTPRIKIGDGTSYLVDLPFIDDILNEHINNTDVHITNAERTSWNNKITSNDIVINETLILTRN